MESETMTALQTLRPERKKLLFLYFVPRHYENRCSRDSTTEISIIKINFEIIIIMGKTTKPGSKLGNSL